MTRFALAALGLFAVAFGALAPAQAATPADVAKVAAMVTDKRVPGLMRRAEYFGDKFMGTTYVFVNRGKRYTLYHSGERIRADDPNSSWLAVWVRKNHTYAKEALVTFSDDGFDGVVDFGIRGSDTDRCYYTARNLVTNKTEGEEYRPRWQKEYDQAIKAALRHLKRVSKHRKS